MEILSNILNTISIPKNIYIYISKEKTNILIDDKSCTFVSNEEHIMEKFLVFCGSSKKG